MFSDRLLRQAEAVLDTCRKQKILLATAESCTGGLISALFTEIPGSSDVFERGFVTYSNAAKMQMLDISESLLNTHGAVSAEVAVAMSQGALIHSSADIATSVTGIAGPGGGTKTKPVGLVYIALANKKKGQAFAEEFYFSGSRSQIRLATVDAALTLLMEHLNHFL